MSANDPKADIQSPRICYVVAMRKSEGSGFAININGAFRTSRDIEGAAAYDAANLLKKKRPAETVTIVKPDGVVVRVLEDGRTA